MPLVPDPATVRYNGYTFPVTRRMEISGSIRKDDARRTVIGIDYTIDIDFTVLASAGDDTESELEDIRKRLTKEGADLFIEGIGFGDLKVNDGSGVWDMAWGPVPEFIQWESIGANRAARCNWKCRVFIPQCDAVSGRYGIVAFNYRNQMSTNLERLTTITTNGYYEIALTRLNANSRVVEQTAGQYKHLLNIPLRANFNRVREDFNESLDKRRMDFTIVDEARSPNQLPWGCTAATARHIVSNSTQSPAVGTANNAQQSVLGRSVMPWEGKITATYTLHPGFPKVVAWNHFNDLRDNIARGVLEPDNGATGENVDKIGTFIMRTFRVDEGLYQENRTISFAVDYMIFSSLRNLMTRGGFARLEPNCDGLQWIQKWRERGFREGVDYYQTQFIPNNDFIIDICTSVNNLPTATRGIGKVEAQGATPTPQATRLSQETSWLQWECSVIVEEDNGTVQQVALNNPIQTTNSLRNFQASPAQQLFPSAGKIESIIQKRRPSRVRLWLTGCATRYFYTIPVPNLVLVNGKIPAEGPTQYARSWVARQMLGVPVWACVWKKEYFIDNLNPGTIDVPRPNSFDMQNGRIDI